MKPVSIWKPSNLEQWTGLQQEYLQTVVAYAIDELEAGHTPSPDVMCNRMIKFGAFVDRFAETADFIASGHHARVDHTGPLSRLLKGVDPAKDQTYFLFTLTREQMQYVRFPLGGMTKAEVRGHAARLGLKVAEKPESQDICFVPDGDYVRFIEEQRGAGTMNGDIVYIDGQVLGSHQGTYRYTLSANDF